MPDSIMLLYNDILLAVFKIRIAKLTGVKEDK